MGHRAALAPSGWPPSPPPPPKESLPGEKVQLPRRVFFPLKFTPSAPQASLPPPTRPKCLAPPTSAFSLPAPHFRPRACQPSQVWCVRLRRPRVTRRMRGVKIPQLGGIKWNEGWWLEDGTRCTCTLKCSNLDVNSPSFLQKRILITQCRSQDKDSTYSLLKASHRGMEAIAKFDFTASGEDELSFHTGDILKILSNQEEWFKAELGSQEGYVPKNFIDIQFPEWFHEGLSRHQAENLLMGKEVGFFIIRASQSSPGDFSISVRHEDDVQHFKVMRDNKGNYFLWTEKFPSLNKLVEYYRTTSISKQKQIFLRDRMREDQGRRGNSLDRRPQGGPHLSGAVGEEIRPAMNRKLSDHPPPPPSQYPPAPPSQQRYLQQHHFHQERRGGSLDINDGHCGMSMGSEMNAALMHRRHTDPVQLQVAGRVRWARALYDFEALEDDELGFRSGEMVEVLDSSNPSWWTGRLHNKLGLFPANYVAPMIR